MIFGAGGVAAIAEGVGRFFESHELQTIVMNYVVLGIALVFETVSWLVAYRGVRKEYPGISPFSAARRSKDSGLFVVLFEDSAAILGLLIALVVGTILATVFPSSHFDAIASVLIGLLLITTAVTPADVWKFPSLMKIASAFTRGFGQRRCTSGA